MEDIEQLRFESHDFRLWYSDSYVQYSFTTHNKNFGILEEFLETTKNAKQGFQKTNLISKMRKSDNYAGNQVRLFLGDLKNGSHQAKVKAMEKLQNYIKSYQPDVIM